MRVPTHRTPEQTNAPRYARPDDGSCRPVGPVVLATVGSTPFDRAATAFAVDVAVECGARLLVVDAVEYPPAGAPSPRYDPGLPPTVAASLRAPGELAGTLGVDARFVRLRGLRPVAALADLVATQGASVLVFGADRARLSWLRPLSRRRYRRAARALQRRTSCPVWLASEVERAPRARRALIPARR